MTNKADILTFRERSPTLPTEVCERIIDFAAEEYLLISRARRWQPGVLETLQACALTCRAWTPRSQLHLFRFVGVQCANDSKKSLGGFYTLLDEHVPLQSYIESLCVSADVEGVTMLHVFPLRAVELAARLDQLYIFQGTVCTPCASLFSICMRQFRAVTQLVLWDVVFASVHDLRRMIDALHGPRRLNITRGTWQSPCTVEPSAAYPRSKTRLERLWFKGEAAWLKDSRTVYFIEWMARSGVASSLLRADFYHAMFVSDKMLIAVQAVLQACHDTVEECILSLGPEVDFTSLSDILSSCRKLYFVRLRCAYDSRTISLLARTLRNITHISYPDLYLPFNKYPACHKPTAEDWDSLDKALQNAPWGSLKRVYMMRQICVVEDPAKFVWGDRHPVGVYDPKYAENWCVDVRESFPLTVKQGKVWCHGNHAPRFIPVT